jgi:hypothetical protein
MNTQITRTGGWAAYCSGIAAIVGMVSLSLFFGIEMGQTSGVHIWGPISDIALLVQMLLLLLVARALYPLAEPAAPLLARASTVLGAAGMLAAALLQFLLIIGVMPFEAEVGPLLVATAGAGVWMIAASQLCRKRGNLPSRLGWLGIAVGSAYVLQPVLMFALGGPLFWMQNIASSYFAMGGAAFVFLLTYIGFPVWAIWLGRALSAGTRAPVAAVARTTQVRN